MQVRKMRKKKFNSYWYSETHTVRHNPPLKVTWADGKVTELHFTREKSNEGYLYSHAKYPTKIKPEDLPEWYMHGRFFKQWGYLSAKGVTDMVYKPNNWVNHLFRDDILFIKYGGSIEQNSVGWCEQYDMVLDGWDMVYFLAYLKVFQNYDVEPYLEQMRDKVRLYQQTNPEEHDCITVEEFNQHFNSKYEQLVNWINGTGEDPRWWLKKTN